MNQQTLIETRELTKKYNTATAVNRLNLQVKEGEIFGFLGPNGAGKTTTILMLLGLTEPTSGTARVCGYNSTRETLKVKRITGYLPENIGFYEDLTGRQNLRYTARLNGIPEKQASQRIDELLDMVRLADKADERVSKYSRGMKQRLGIADVLVKDPKVAFLDEPTLGIDPDGVNRILDIIARMSREQKITVLLSSHLLQQVQRICHRVGILVKGKLLVEGSIDQLGMGIKEGGQMTIEVQASEFSSQLLDSIRQIEGVTGVKRSGDLLLVTSQTDVRPQVSRAVVESQSALYHLRLQTVALEEIYMKYFNEG